MACALSVYGIIWSTLQYFRFSPTNNVFWKHQKVFDPSEVGSKFDGPLCLLVSDPNINEHTLMPFRAIEELFFKNM